MLLLFGILIGAAVTAPIGLYLLITMTREAYQRGLDVGAQVRLAPDDVGIEIVRQEARHRQR